MDRHDYESCVQSMRLADGTLWPIPIVLPVADTELGALNAGAHAALVDEEGEVLAAIEIEDIFKADHERETLNVYGTMDLKHPGVAAVLAAPQTYAGGKITLLKSPSPEFPEYTLTPLETRARFSELGWSFIVGFQTRNPVHRAHEYLQKVALETVDGLFLHPLVGTTKDDDLPAAMRMRCYEVLLQGYYPQNRALLGVYRAAMRYAGPREAVLHAIVRKNYGCSHFIVGRDHAGAGSYYGTFDAQHIFDDIEEELGVKILRFDNAFWCTSCEGMATAKTCPHSADDHVVLSGTRVRELLRSGQRPPAEFTRPEIADILIQSLAEQQMVKA
jgi:sulfate adenylyltransferase